MAGSKEEEIFSAWHPGITSSIPERLRPYSTIFRAENSHVSYEQAKELSGFCGIKPEKLVAFKLERLIQHEVLVRVTADLSVPDGPNYEELGINLRSMVARIYDHYIFPDLENINEEFEAAISLANSFILEHLDASIYKRDDSKEIEEKRSFLSKIFGGKQKPKVVDKELLEIRALPVWQDELAHVQDDIAKECLVSMLYVIGKILGQRGRLVTDRELTVNIVLNRFCNSYGSKWVSDRISSLIKTAASEEGYRLLPKQEKPVVMNVKGASASGKSTIRTQQRELAKRLGVPWKDFALISPDYWRKYMLDYDSLGEDYKYAGMLTGQELEIVDKKLDHYMASKAQHGNMSHLLIDRFRFDSFTLDAERSADSKLLTRFGDRIFMFFMITSPVETVERAWKRGLTTGRFKAVDDLLYHNIEAYTGMPELFFSWALSTNKSVHFEFLNNNVKIGELPKTVAFGWNRKITILDIKSLLDVDRYRKINVEAKTPDQVFTETEADTEHGMEFLLRCFETIPEIIFADQSSGKAYAQLAEGELVWCDRQYIKNLKNKEVQLVFDKLHYADCESQEPASSIHVENEKQFTFGQWA